MFGRLQTHHRRMGQHVIGQLLDVRTDLARWRADRGIDLAGDRLDDLSSSERRPLATQLVHDGADHGCGCERRTKALRTDGRVDDCGGFPARITGFAGPTLVEAQLGDVPVRFGATRVEHREPIDPAPLIGFHRPPERPFELGDLRPGGGFHLGAADAEACQQLPGGASQFGLTMLSDRPPRTPSRRVSSARNAA